MDLRERLRRLDRPPAPPANEESPVSDLRRRLDRLLGPGAVVPANELEPAGARRRAESLDRLVPGRRVRSAEGQTFLCETLLAPDHEHGRMPLREGAKLDGPSRLFPEFLAEIEDPAHIAFLDTETTGLAGGAGTVPFLVGVARWTAEGLRIAQLFLEDLDAEAALLDALRQELAGVHCLVTYNGRPFDVPLLENRHILNRKTWPLDRRQHLDLLPPARTLWRFRHADCRLVTLERSVLGYHRVGDVPGAEIPGIYLRYLKRGADRRLASVFEHNRLDLLSLAGLLWAAGRAAEGHAEGTGAGVGLLHARRARTGEARAALEASLTEDLPPAVRRRALKELALAQEACGDWPRALEAWAELRRLCGGDPLPVERMARLLERRLGEPGRALGVVEEALGEGPWALRDRQGLERRRARLEALRSRQTK